MKRRVALLIIIAVPVALGIGELFLRLTSHHPGVFNTSGGVELVDSLIVYRNFVTDEFGIYKFSSWIYDSVPKSFDYEAGEIQRAYVRDNVSHGDGVLDVYRQFYDLVHPSAPHTIRYKVRRWMEKSDSRSEFDSTYHKLKSGSQADEWSKALLYYTEHPFNEEGYRSIPFRPSQTSHIKILLIGDSFVYGLSANPFYNSFADILLARGYVVYNTGIPGTDPAQYAAICRKYAASLHPDVVIFCFFSGNDIMLYPREPRADQPHEYLTNAGMLESSPLGQFLTAAQAYDFYLSMEKIPKTSTFNKVCSHSCVLTLIWGAMYQRGWVEHPVIKATNDALVARKDSSEGTTKKYIDECRNTCDSLCIPYVYTVIPDRYYHGNAHRQFFTIDTPAIDHIFGGRRYSYPAQLKESDYKSSNIHFNNSGSARFADFLDSLIIASLGKNK